MGSPEPPRRYRHSHDAAFMAGYDTPPEFTPDEPVPPDGTRPEGIIREALMREKLDSHSDVCVCVRCVRVDAGLAALEAVVERVNQLEADLAAEKAAHEENLFRRARREALLEKALSDIYHLRRGYPAAPTIAGIALGLLEPGEALSAAGEDAKP